MADANGLCVIGTPLTPYHHLPAHNTSFSSLTFQTSLAKGIANPSSSGYLTSMVNRAVDLNSDEPVICVESDGQYAPFFHFPFSLLLIPLSNTSLDYLAKFSFVNKKNLLLPCTNLATKYIEAHNSCFSSALLVFLAVAGKYKI